MPYLGSTLLKNEFWESSAAGHTVSLPAQLTVVGATEELLIACAESTDAAIESAWVLTPAEQGAGRGPPVAKWST